MNIHIPSLNACLNTASFVLLLTGYIFIRRKEIEKHRKCMISACVTSTLFLISYLIYHYQHGSTKFQGTGAIRTVYFTILITHTILAVAILPPIIMLLRYAFKNELEKHRALARGTFPFWMYVSLTGVIVYWMLYRL